MSFDHRTQFGSPLRGSSPVVIVDINEFMRLRDLILAQGQSIGFVPTMGALHSGHASLLRRARAENDVTVLSIYVNPTQFDNPEDLNKYPSTLDQDKIIAEAEKVDYILLPTYPQIYADKFRYKLSENEMSLKLCGAHRPGHFDGVLTVVMKLFNIVGPTRAYLGEKDQQQLQLIRGMVDSFFLSVKIVACPTVRENDGLAMSSRNVRLTNEERDHAPAFFQVLTTAMSAAEARQLLEASHFDVDYVEDIDERRYGAIRLGAVRLIDNVPVPASTSTLASLRNSLPLPSAPQSAPQLATEQPAGVPQ